MSDLTAYRAAVAANRVAFEPAGLDVVPHQAHAVDFALRTGRAALFLDTGLGKTFCALEWGRIIEPVADQHGLSATEILGDGRKQRVTHARQHAMATLMEHGRSLSTVARLMGRHHTTGLHGVRAHARRASKQEEAGA